MFRIANNLLTDYYRNQASQVQALDKVKFDFGTKGNREDSPEQIVENRDEWNDVEAAILQLPEPLRTVLIMNVVGKLNSTEIGESLNIPAGTVRYRLSMARKQILNILSRGQEKEAKIHHG